ncbi:MAG: DnaJ domain-containing protein [Paludibacteraceae bacterium]|nr:DnaJ domain-containing protein [Paludibacteraceae bacterium]
MDKEKIREVFLKWGKERKLTKNGALRVNENGFRGSLFGCLTLIAVLIGPWGIYELVSSSVELSKTSSHILVLSAIVVPLIGIVLISFFGKSLFYEDRLVISSFEGSDLVYPYSELISVDYHLVVTDDSKYMALTLRFKHERLTYRDERLVRFFSTCFKPIFRNRPFYEDMFRLFANVICLKEDAAYRARGWEAALKYLSPLSESKYCVYDCEEHLLRCMEEDRQEYIDTCLAILKNKGVDYADRLELLSHLFECAYASDGMVDEEELEHLSRIAYYLRIKDWDFLSLKCHFEAMKQNQYAGQTESEEQTKQRERYQSAYSNRLKEAYKILGLNEKATLEDVKTAYRTQVKSCHPDTLPPTAKDSEREEAAIRFRAVTEAYDFLCAELVVEPVSVTK